MYRGKKKSIEMCVKTHIDSVRAQLLRIIMHLRTKRGLKIRVATPFCDGMPSSCGAHVRNSGVGERTDEGGAIDTCVNCNT